MDKITKEEAIEKWTAAVAQVFKAEDELHRVKPEWKKRLKFVLENDAPKVAQEYCRDIAEIIVKNAEDNKEEGGRYGTCINGR